MQLKTLGLYIILGCAACGDVNTTAPQKLGEDKRAINSLRLRDMAGISIDMEKYKGKTVFINFWATWCKPCIQEMPSIEKAQSQLSGKDVVFLLASNETIEEIAQFSGNSGYSLNFVRVDNFEEQDVQALPTTFIFNRRGKLVFSETGIRRWDEAININLITDIAKQYD